MRLMLRGLRLPAIAAVYEDLALKAAKANLTHEEFLYELLRAECLQREEHRVARLLRLSGLPPDKTFPHPAARAVSTPHPPATRAAAQWHVPRRRDQCGRRGQTGRRQIARACSHWP